MKSAITLWKLRQACGRQRRVGRPLWHEREAGQRCQADSAPRALQGARTALRHSTRVWRAARQARVRHGVRAAGEAASDRVSRVSRLTSKKFWHVFGACFTYSLVAARGARQRTVHLRTGHRREAAACARTQPRRCPRSSRWSPPAHPSPTAQPECVRALGYPHRPTTPVHRPAVQAAPSWLACRRHVRRE